MKQLQACLFTLVSLAYTLYQKWSTRLLTQRNLLRVMTLVAMVMVTATSFHIGVPSDPGPFPWP